MTAKRKNNGASMRRVRAPKLADWLNAPTIHVTVINAMNIIEMMYKIPIILPVTKFWNEKSKSDPKKPLACALTSPPYPGPVPVP